MSKQMLHFSACGGDGTVGWILSVMDSMSFPRGRPAIGIIPLGTGNDLSRSLNWGGKFRDKPLRKVLLDIAKADVIAMDRWMLDVTPVAPDPVGGGHAPGIDPHSIDDKLVSPERFHEFLILFRFHDFFDYFDF